MLTTSQASSLRALNVDESTKPFAELATRALVFEDAEAAQQFVSAVLLVVVQTREAWGVGREGASEPEALLLAHMLFLLRCIALRFPSLAVVLPAPPIPQPAPEQAKERAPESVPVTAPKRERPAPAPSRPPRPRARKKKGRNRVPKVKR